MFPEYDVIVVGAGHAGCEAAAAAANLGSKVLLITMNMQTIAQMSCNPAMGGIAKGQIVREIDAMGGYSGIVSDASTIQFRMLNRSKGPAMWSPRSQNDRMVFATKWREMLEQTSNVDFYQDMVRSLLVKDNRVYGVVTGLGHEIKSKSVVVTSGTFLNGIIHIGEKQLGGGRISEKAATGITEQLVELGFEADRLKTGFDRSPMFQGRIDGVGPRYCPSIEDKINRFADRDRHQLFVEPEGWNTVEIYVNGFSTSLPEEVQIQALRTVPGFENCRVFRPGYAIEYDYFPPTQLTYTLETKLISNLFFAGQINGTTGYEEAACQGLMAGINAHQKSRNLDPVVLKRSDAYIGVLIDDLISKGTDEPYRMFTSRAEYRTLLRQDNADLRLTEMSYRLGLASQERMDKVLLKKANVAAIKKILSETPVEPNEANEFLQKIGSAALLEKQKASKILLRPGVDLAQLLQVVPALTNALQQYHPLDIEQAEIQLKYERYIEKEEELVQKMSQMENLIIPDSFDYNKVHALSNEALQKFNKIKPRTLGQASRISGVNPSDVQILMVYMGR